MGRTQRNRTLHKKYQQKNATDWLPELYKYMRTMCWTNDTQLTISNFPLTGRGLCSKKRNFDAGDELIRVPAKCLITIATLEADVDFQTHFNDEKFNKDQRISFQSLMALNLLHQQHLGEKSPMHAYLKSIPAQFTTPYFCALNELQCLPEAILEKTVAQNRKIRDNFTNFKSLLAAEYCVCCGKKYIDEIFTLNAFKWAYFAVNSRSVYIASRQLKPSNCYFQNLLGIDDTNLALAPFLDLFNHNDTVATTAELVRCTNSKQYDFVITLQTLPATVKSYSQLFISYGALSNLKLLTDYGFILPGNTHDLFEFSLFDIEHLINNEKSFKEQTFHRNKFKFIRDHNLHDQMFVHPTDGMSHNLRVVLHLIFKEPSHFPNILNQVAFGDVSQMESCVDELRLLLSFKIAEYRGFMCDLKKLPALSDSGKVANEYLQECVTQLDNSLNNLN